MASFDIRRTDMGDLLVGTRVSNLIRGHGRGETLIGAAHVAVTGGGTVVEFGAATGSGEGQLTGIGVVALTEADFLFA